MGNPKYRCATGRGGGTIPVHAGHAPPDELDRKKYPQLARAPHTSPAQAYVDDAVPMTRDKRRSRWCRT